MASEGLRGSTIDRIIRSTGLQGEDRFCGERETLSPSYYYMIYHVRPVIGQDNNGYDIIGAAGIAIARAAKSAIDTWAYPYASNPWVKFRQIVPDMTSSLNWGESGVGGIESVLWNSQYENGLLGRCAEDRFVWRAFPKLSYNTYLNQYYSDQMLLLCKGGISSGVTGLVLHTSDNLLEWSDSLTLMIDEVAHGAGTYYTYEYPTLVGYDSTYGGYSGMTCEYNKLYYQRMLKKDSGLTTDQDLYRCPVRIEIQ